MFSCALMSGVLMLKNIISLTDLISLHSLFCDKCYRVLSLCQAVYVDDYLSDQTHWILNGELRIQHQVEHLFPCENRIKQLSGILRIQNEDISRSNATVTTASLKSTETPPPYLWPIPSPYHLNQRLGNTRKVIS